MFGKTKTITIPPGATDIDLMPILPIVDSKIFPRLREIKQLGPCSLDFPAANHTRFEHSLGAYSLSTQRNRHLVDAGACTREEAITLDLSALLHDIGHAPYSHATEPLCPINHNERGLLLIEELRPEIEECGGNMDLLRSILRREHPFSQLISHRPLGVDKLDYVTRDSWYTIGAVNLRLENMINHVHYIENKLVVDRRFLADVMNLHRAYINLHVDVYFRKAAVIAQYLLQQTVAYAIQSQDIDVTTLQTMHDAQLMVALENAKEPIVREMYGRLRRPHLPKAAIVFRVAGAHTLKEVSDKEIRFYDIPMCQLKEFSLFDQREVARVHETAIAEIAGILPHEVLLTPIASPERFIPDDVLVYSNREIIGTLGQESPKHYEAMTEATAKWAAVRVCVPEKHRAKMAHRSISDGVTQYLMDLV